MGLPRPTRADGPMASHPPLRPRRNPAGPRVPVSSIPVSCVAFHHTRFDVKVKTLLGCVVDDPLLLLLSLGSKRLLCYAELIEGSNRRRGLIGQTPQ